MKKILYIFIFVVVILQIGSVTDVKASPTVSYISSEGFYINGGTNYDLHKNDTMLVVRGDSLIATCVINNISRKSSSCIILEMKKELKIGDMILTTSKMKLFLKELSKDEKKTITQTKKKYRSSENHISGYVSSQHYFITDMSNSSLSSYQPSVRTKLKVENLFGQKIKLQLKHRSRYYKRSSSLYVSSDQNNWSHRLYELAIYSTDKSLPIQFSFGRQSVYQMRGIGFIDGIFLSKKINDKMVVGSILGMEPDNLNQKISFDKKKAGFFLVYKAIDSKSRRLTLTAAFAGSYIADEVNREYVYWQADYSSAKLTINQSAEFDFFRSVRKEAANKTLSLTSYYGRVNYSLTSKYSLYLSFDTRERIRYFDDRLIPDSLFDESNNRGIKFGVRLKPFEKISISINTGVRMRANSISDNKYGSIAVTALRFPQKRSSLTARFSYMETMFTTAYRPSLSYRFPIRRGMYLTLNGTTNIYSSTVGRTSTSYIDAQTYYTLSGNYFISTSIRQYFEKDLQSNQFFFEFGKHF